MKRGYLISSIASIALLTSFSMSGCGGGSSSSDTNVTEVGSTVVRVSDAYVLNATVKAEDKVFNIHNENGEYEIAEANVTGELSAIGGINDLNSNNIIDEGEPFAPELKAPSGYKNITPFTTILLNGVDISAEADYQAVAKFAPNYDFDVVAEGETFENGIAQATAIAALRLSSGGDGSSTGEVISSITGDSSGTGDDSLPGTGGDVSSSSSVSSVASSISSSSSSAVSSITSANSGGVLPSASVLRGVLPSDDGTATPASSSSIQSSSSSSSSLVSSSSSTQSSTQQSSSSTSSTSNTLAEAIAKIKAATSADELNDVLKDYMGTYNGSYIPSSSVSSEAQEYNSSENSLSSSMSSVIDTADDCLPGFDCSVTSSSSISSVLTSSSVSSESFSSVAQTSSDQEICEAAGNTWSNEINQCLAAPTSSSSSSTAPSQSTGSVLPS